MTPHERESQDPVLNIRISRRGLLVIGGTLGFGLVRCSGTSTSSQRPTFDSRPTFVPNTAPAIAPARTSVGTPFLQVDNKSIASPDKEGVIQTAQFLVSLLFNYPPERVLEEYAESLKNDWKKYPHWREQELRQIKGTVEWVVSCGATVAGYNKRTYYHGDGGAALSFGDNASRVEAVLDRGCGYHSRRGIIIDFGRDSKYGGTDPNKWKVTRIIYDQ